MLARSGVVIAVEEGALFGDPEPGARALWFKFDRGQGNRYFPIVQVHLVSFASGRPRCPSVWDPGCIRLTKARLAEGSVGQSISAV